ncbi:MAG: cytochrome c [Armatimonadota bacterium]|nr:cytochrome c [Armatimonadota bacterium]MDR7445094.1 cytochrome c [Armatimonadota bacterium]MDR7569878.1 cytochrome c [Armatimonadota bacterium]MDR7614179.1 cytochrome c [Armatimonadota bacterium]
MILGAAVKVGLSAALPRGVQDQIERGERLYAFYCASCHGRRGEGGDRVPALIGPSRQYCRRFATALDLYRWVARQMPPEDLLRPQEYWDILAFLLDANGELPRARVLNPETAGRISLGISCRKGP